MKLQIKNAVSSKSLDFDTFLSNSVAKVENNLLTDKEIFDYTKLNIHRIKRILRTYQPSENIKTVIKKLNKDLIFLVITEDWCGDSAQNLPYIYKISSLSSKIDLRILERDSNLDIMDLYLTNNSRSIPKLVCFDKEFNELFQWGPRPIGAIELFKDLKAKGFEKHLIIEQLHHWYALNKGIDIENEFETLINKSL